MLIDSFVSAQSLLYFALTVETLRMHRVLFKSQQEILMPHMFTSDLANITCAHMPFG